MALTRRALPGTGALIAGLVILLPHALRAETPPVPPLPPSIVDAIEAMASRPDQCPNVEALQALVEGAKDWASNRPAPDAPTAGSPGAPAGDRLPAAAEQAPVVAVAAYAARRLRAGGSGSAAERGADSQCNCIEELSTALSPVDPKRADAVQQVFADAFPDCDIAATAPAGDATMQGSAGPRPGLPQWKNLPGYGLFGEPAPGCGADCLAIEPPPSHDASRTAL